MAEYEDDLYEDDENDEQEMALAERLQVLEGWAVEQERARQQDEPEPDLWDDPNVQEAFVEHVQALEQQLNRQITQREFEKLQRHFESHGEPPLDAKGVTYDLGKDEGRRQYMADRMGAAETYSSASATNDGGEGE